MGLMTALTGAKTRSSVDGDPWLYGGSPFSAQTEAGVQVNQTTALQATTVMSAVLMLCEDFAKMTPSVLRIAEDGKREEAIDHELYDLLYEPNDWQTYFEFAEMMQFSLVMRGNAYAVKIRDRRGRVVRLIPVNADWVMLWEAPGGDLFYRITVSGLHLRAELAGQPFLIPAEDMLHVRGFSQNGLLGGSRIALAKEAIALSLGYERQQSAWLGQGAAPSGALTTDAKLTKEAAERISQDWRDKKGGLQNAGRILVLEQGLKYEKIGMTAAEADLINSRVFQIDEIARIFRIPPHMLGAMQKIAAGNLEQLSQSYVNLTMSGYTSRWGAKLDTNFQLRRDRLFIGYDLSTLTYADMTTRFNNLARGISGGFLTPNEARAYDKRNPLPGGDKLLQPTNMAAAGSHVTGGGADGGGHPEKGSADESVKP